MSTSHEERIEGVAALLRRHDLWEVGEIVHGHANAVDLFPGLLLLLVSDHGLLSFEYLAQSLLIP